MNTDSNANYTVHDESSERIYFTNIPNIIFSMGLGAYEIAYYCLLKKIAGEKGSCFQSRKNLAKQVGCGVTKIKEMNQIFERPFDFLGGKPLIKIREQKNADGSQSTNSITMIDIWPENIAYCSQKIPKTTYTPRSPGAPPPGRQTTPPRSPGDPKEQPFKEKPYLKKQQQISEPKVQPIQVAENRCCSFEKEKRNCFDRLPQKLQEKTIPDLCQRFSLQQIEDAVNAAIQYISGGKKPRTMEALLTGLLNKGAKPNKTKAMEIKEKEKEIEDRDTLFAYIHFRVSTALTYYQPFFIKGFKVSIYNTHLLILKGNNSIRNLSFEEKNIIQNSEDLFRQCCDREKLLEFEKNNNVKEA